MSRIEVNEIAKTPTGAQVTIDSKLVLDDTIKLKNYTTSEVSAILNPEDGQMVFNSQTGTVQVYRELTSIWTDVGGTEHTQAFNTIVATGQPNITTNATDDTLTFIAGNDITITLNSANQSIQIDHDGLDTSAMTQNIVPLTDSLYNIGSNDDRWANVYLDRIYIGNMDIQAINLGVNSDKLVISDQVEVSGIIESTNTGGTGIPVDGGLNPDSIKTDSLSEKTSSANIDLESDLVLASGVTIDFTNGSATGLSGGGGGTNKNLLINGGFQVWQKSTTGTNANDGLVKSVDRWVTGGNYVSGSLVSIVASTIDQGVFTFGQSDVPDNPLYYARWYKTSGTGTSIMEQRIEGVETAAGQSIAISFWARTASGSKTLKTAVTQTFGVQGGQSSPVTTQIDSHSVTTTWTKFTATVSVPSVSGKTKGTADGFQAIRDRLAFQFVDDNGATFDYYIANVKVELGGSVTAWEPEKYIDVVQQCWRYYQLIAAGVNSIFASGGGTTRANVYDGIIDYRVPLYRRPTLRRSGQLRFIISTEAQNGNYINTNLNNNKTAYGSGCWNADLGTLTSRAGLTFAQAITNQSSAWMYWDAEI